MSRANKRLILIFAKQPVPGRAKTRLAATAGTDRASELARAFLEDVLLHASDASRRMDAALAIAFAPDDAGPWFASRARDLGVAPPWTFPQAADPGLGARLEHGFRTAFERASHVLAVGSDSPDLDPGDYARALGSLEEPRALLAPARDGGYWAIGLVRGTERPERALLDPIGWSTSSALADTRAALERRGIPVVLGDERDDVDDAEDLRRLLRRLRGAPGNAPRTAACLGIVGPDGALVESPEA